MNQEELRKKTLEYALEDALKAIGMSSQRMHDQEKSYSPPLRRLEDIPVAKPVMRREPPQHRPHGFHNPNMEALKAALGEIGLMKQNEVRKYAPDFLMGIDPYVLDIMEELSEEPPKQDLGTDNLFPQEPKQDDKKSSQSGDKKFANGTWYYLNSRDGKYYDLRGSPLR